MNRTTLLAISALLAVSASSASAAAYFEDFEGFTVNTDVDGQFGWGVNDNTSNPTFVGTWGGVDAGDGQNATLGGVSPLGASTITLSRSVSMPVVGVGTGDLLFGFKSAVTDSIDMAPPAGLGISRDTFGVRLLSGGTNVFTLFLRPDSQSTDPDAETGFWNISWSSGAGPETVHPLALAYEEDASYVFEIAMTDDGLGGVTFVADFNGVSPMTGSLAAGSNLLTVDTIQFFQETTNGAADPGSNYLTFDNVNLVPEPSSALFALIGAAGLLRRRR